MTITTLHVKNAFLVIICSYLLTACGFKLRGQYLLDPALQTLTVSSTDKYGELTRLVKQHLVMNNVNVVNTTSQKTPELRIVRDALERRTLSTFPNGQVAEYQLIYQVNYQLLIEDQATRSFQFELNRDYQDDPNFALAKSRELNLLLSEMRKLAADRILRDMASIRL
jgi:LPS-assembly lipoprotein